MSRLPIRLRLTLVFAAIVAAVLTGTGLFLYLQLERSLDQAIDQGLQLRIGNVLALSRQQGIAVKGAGAEPDESFAQLLLASNGRLIAGSAGVGDSTPLLSRAQLARARRSASFLERPGSEEGHRLRLLAGPLRALGRNLVGVVGTSLSGRDNTLASLRGELLVGGPLALLLVSLAGYALAAGALRPVERMRRAAAASAGGRGLRLPLPRARDELARLGSTLNELLAEQDEALAQAERALAHERRFASDASHELRTPLALLKGELEVALRRPRAAGELEAAVVSAATEADRLAELAEDLLLLARLDEGALPLRQERVKVSELFRTVSARFAGRAAQAGRAITTSASRDAELLADGLRLEQALANLVQNSLQHGAGTIELGAIEREEQLELHVRDRGPGFPDSFLGRAFERFSRPDAARTGGGTGLGLAIVATIAQAHGGQARAANRKGGGADVWLALPQTSRSRPRERAAQAARP